MSGDRDAPGLWLAVALTLAAVAVLAYLDWWRQGELAELNSRVDALSSQLRSLAVKPARPRKPREDPAA